MSSSTSLTVIRPATSQTTRSPARRGTIVRQPSADQTGNTSQHEYIEADFQELLDESWNPKDDPSPYVAVMAPDFLFKRRNVNYYA